MRLSFGQLMSILLGVASCLFLVTLRLFINVSTSHTLLKPTVPILKGAGVGKTENVLSRLEEFEKFSRSEKFLGPDHAALSRARTAAAGLRNLTDVDVQYYTIRINTWKRNAQLLTSIDHHAACEGVRQIQVVWSDPDGEPPEEVVRHGSGKVVVERHAVNSLNERFNVMSSPPTLGILSVDDDVLRPCAALDAGFFRWTRNPSRMVGYDPRVHVEKNGRWEYGPRSVTFKSKEYSMILTRFTFVHLDYLKIYTDHLPRKIFDLIAKIFNCEDIAMTLLVSALTGGAPPILANAWAISTQVKLPHDNPISKANNHTDVRNFCMEAFSGALDLRSGAGRLRRERLVGTNYSSPVRTGATLNVTAREYDHWVKVKEFSLLGREEFMEVWKKMVGEVREKANGLSNIG